MILSISEETTFVWRALKGFRLAISDIDQAEWRVELEDYLRYRPGRAHLRTRVIAALAAKPLLVECASLA